MPYELLADGAVVAKGIVDTNGQIPLAHRNGVQQYMVRFGTGMTMKLPTAEAWRGEEGNATLANTGFHHHEQARQAQSDIETAQDRAQYRDHYQQLLPPPQEG